MTPFHAPVEDILFSLRHVAKAGSTPGWDDEEALDILQHFGQFAEGVIAPLNGAGDQEGARLVDGRVQMPAGFKAAFDQLATGGWQGLTAPERYGGMAASPLVSAGVSELFSGANHALEMVCNLVPGAIETLLHFGTEAQRSQWIPRLCSGEALSTMCLTEPGAGSDLSAIRTKAVRHGDAWRLDGEKIFISGGDQDLSDDILHLVLARSGAAQDGTAGLSLFLCPKQPSIRVTRLEEKMGLHASPTCQVVLDGAEGALVGKEGEGLRAMFTVMNHARLDVALQGVAHAARAADIAAIYAAERRQGKDASGKEARLMDHADVRRMLDRQARLAMGARAMCHITLVEIARGTSPAVLEVLTSLSKVFGSEAGTESADLGLQILGGYGYLTEYGIEQIWRDARICAIYEGANGIHTRSLVTRGLRVDAVEGFDNLVCKLLDGADCPALDRWRDFRQRLVQSEDPLPHARMYYQAMADLFEQAVWYQIRAAAHHHPEPGRILRLAEAVLASDAGPGRPPL